MSAVQFLPKAEARPGDRVREVDHPAPDPLSEVVRLDGGTGVFVRQSSGERFVPFARIEAVIRPIDEAPFR